MRRFASNVLIIVSSDIARRLFGFGTIAYLARTITTADFGTINIGFTVLSYALMASSGGLSTLGTREVAGGADIGFVKNLLGLKFVAAIVVYLLVALIVLLFVSAQPLISLILILCISLVVQAFLMEWYFQGKEEMTVIGIGRFAAALVYFLLAIFLVHSSADLLRIAFASVAADLVATFILFTLYAKRTTAQVGLSGKSGKAWKEWKVLIRRAMPLGAGSILAHFSINLPPLVIGVMMTNTDVGVYSAASKMVFFLLMFDRVLGTVLLPASARLYASSPATLAERLNTALRWILIVAVPFCIGGTLVADRLIPFVFGAQYQSASEVFRVFVWYMMFTMIHTVYTSGIVAVGKEKDYSRVMMMSAVVYGISIIVCTKLFGILGAAAAVVGSEAVTLILMRRAFHNSVKTHFPKSILSILLAAVLMSAAVLLLPPAHILMTVLIGAAVYSATLFVTRAVSVADILSLVKKT